MFGLLFLVLTNAILVDKYQIQRVTKLDVKVTGLFMYM